MENYKTVFLLIGLALIAIAMLGAKGFIIEVDDKSSKKRKKVLRSLKTEVALFLFIVGLTLCFIPQTPAFNHKLVQKDGDTYTYPKNYDKKNRGNAGLNLYTINPNLTPEERARAEGSAIAV